MPHIHLETTPGLVESGQTVEILSALVARLSGFPTIGAHGVKAYATVYDEFAVGEGAAPGFIHLRVEILDGRAPSLVQEMANGLYAELRERFHASLTSGAAKATMELREMASSTYRK